MTAGIGIFNKQAAVLAADSAATIGNGRKVFNTANKIFPLQTTEKIGVLIYNNSAWLGIPMEVIIKLYKERDIRKFKNLLDYKDDFIAFLENDIIKYLSQDRINDYLSSITFSSIDYFLDETNRLLNLDISNNVIKRPSNEKKERELFEQYFIEIIKDELEGLSEIDYQPKNNFIDFTKKSFEGIYNKQLKPIISGFITYERFNDNAAIQKLFLDFLHKRLINDFIEDDDFVGLVFSGYGEADIFPAFFEIRFSGLINGKVKYQVYRKSAITDKNPSEIASFAQSEMAATFMEGINPELEETISSSLISNLKKLQNDISEKFKINVDEMNDLFRDTYSKVRIELDDKKHTEMVRPVIETVSILRKEDLIEVAESLVGITSLKRKTSLEIETVGGPVDIAIITKSEGFVWVKRKEKLNGF